MLVVVFWNTPVFLAETAGMSADPTDLEAVQLGTAGEAGIDATNVCITGSAFTGTLVCTALVWGVRTLTGLG